MGVSAPKGSRGRSESPLVASAEAKARNIDTVTYSSEPPKIVIAMHIG